MRITRRYSHNNGKELIEENHSDILKDIEKVISSIDAESCRLKEPKDKEKARAKRAGVTLFYSPRHLNALFDWYFFQLGWDIKPRIKTHDVGRTGYREMDFLKDRVGVEVQMGKYSFLVYDMVAKLVIFRNLGIIECGCEICPMASMLPQMSSGIGAFEQVVWDLEARGVADIDVPVLVLGIEPEGSKTRLKFPGGKTLSIQEEPPSYYEAGSGKPKQEALFEMHTEPEIVLNRYRKKGLPQGTLERVRETGQQV
jgi:hypothetical protein